MSIVGGLDIHRKQLTFDYVEVETGRWERGRIAPADREHMGYESSIGRLTSTNLLSIAPS